MATILHDSNKTDDVIFLPSSTALRAAQGGAGVGRAHSSSTPRRAVPPPAEAPQSSGLGMETDVFGGLDDEDGGETDVEA